MAVRQLDLYLSRTKDFEPWRLGDVPGANVLSYDTEGFSAKLTLAGDLPGLLQAAEALAARLDIEGWQLLDLACQVAATRGQARDLIDDPRYRRELDDLLAQGEDGPVGPSWDWAEFESGDLVLRWLGVTLHSRGDELLSAVVYSSEEAARASFLDCCTLAGGIEEGFINERSKVGRKPRLRPTELAERSTFEITADEIAL
jgi:hypothetical protein